MTKEALRLALEAFNNLAAWNDGEVGSHIDEPYSAEVAREAITAIKAALEAKDEPWTPDDMAYRPNGLPQRTWVGLTDKEAAECWTYNDRTSWKNIEAKLRSKNT
jgi:hypothetical protein